MTGKASSSRSHSEDPRAAQLIGVVALSLGLWVVIWDAFASLFSAVFR
jgi:hypothetical protein